MDSKAKILALLEGERGRPVSGACIAERLGVSRNAVWKAVGQLKKDGYVIRATSNKGYCLDKSNDILSASGMLPYLASADMAGKVHVYDCLPSTNLTAKGMALDGGEHGTVILAESQTHGKGRYNRGFCSPPGGIYMSVILRSEHVPFSALTLVTAFTAVSVCEAIEAVTDKRPQIKWVNDIFWGGKKICGISTEAVSDFESGQTPWLVVGIGINYHTPEAAFPPELRSVVGSLYEGEPPPSPRNRLAAEIINRMVTPDRQSEAQMLTAYKQRMFMLGKKVTVTTPTQVYTATAADLDPMGQLVVIKEDGQTVVLCAGEISVSSTL